MDNQEKRKIDDNAMPVKISKSEVDKVRRNQKMMNKNIRSFANILGEWYEITGVSYSNLYKFTQQKKEHLHNQSSLID